MCLRVPVSVFLCVSLCLCMHHVLTAFPCTNAPMRTQVSDGKRTWLLSLARLSGGAAQAALIWWIRSHLAGCRDIHKEWGGRDPGGPGPAAEALPDRVVIITGSGRRKRDRPWQTVSVYEKVSACRCWTRMRRTSAVTLCCVCRCACKRVCVRFYVCMCVLVCACVRACERVCVRMSMQVLESPHRRTQT